MWQRSTPSRQQQQQQHQEPSSPFKSSSSSSPSPHPRAVLLSQRQQQLATSEGQGSTLRRAKSTHSFNHRPSSWYQQDDEDDSDDIAGEPAATYHHGWRPRSKSLTNHPSLTRSSSLGIGGGGGGIPSRSNSSSFLSGMLLAASSARTGVVGGGGAFSLSSSASSSTRSLSFSARRWASLLTPQTDMWREAEHAGLQVSPQDDRQYRMIRLPNQLRAIVVSDPRTEKAAAAMSVKVGAGQDPRPTPGLAHFCEHMLFLGSGKYPRENTYKDLVNRHGGHANASTSMDLTVYQFDLAAPEHYPAVLDVFAQFFIDPLFTESATERELKAIDAENSKNLINDYRRLLQITKAAVVDPSHPWAKFSTGNLKTLRDDLPPGFSVRSALLALHKAHYHAGNMALALVGPASLDELEALVRVKFGAVAAKEQGREEEKGDAVLGAEEEAVLAAAAEVREKSSSSSSRCGPGFRDPFPPRFMPSSSPAPSTAAAAAVASGNSGGGGGGIAAALSISKVGAGQGGPEPAVPVVRVVPLRDKRELRMLWALPPVRHLYRAPPSWLLSHLVGHEGGGSIFSVLHGLGWASGVSAGLFTSHDDQAIFEVTVSLTEAGQPLWQDVAGLVLSYLQLVAQASPEELGHMWDEVRAMASVSFRFQQKQPEYSYASELARRLQLYADPHVLSGGHLYDGLDLPALETCLQRLTREENLVVLLSLKDNDAPHLLNRTEPWYGVPFGMELIPAHQVRQWSCSHVDSLRLPRPNPYIPEEFDLIHAGETVPPSATPEPPERALVTAEKELELWYKLDRSFKQPRAYVVVDLCTPLVQKDPAAAELLTRYFDHLLAEQTYDASIAGLHWSVSTTSQGLSLRFRGFSHKLQSLLFKVLESLVALHLHEGLFQLAKEKALDAYRNVKLARPDEHCAIYLALLLIDGRWHWRDKLRRVQALDMADLGNYHHELLSTASVKVGCFGNVSKESAMGVAEQVERLLKRNPKFVLARAPELPITRIAMLDRGTEYRLRAPVPNDADENSAVTVYFQLGLVGPGREGALLRLLAQILKEPTFTQLRTREQLGYIVAGGAHVLWNKSMVGGLSFRVLSKTHGPEEILERVEAFLPRFRDDVLAQLSPEALAKHKASLVTNLLEPPKTLVGECHLLWAEVTNETREWQRGRLMADAVEAATLPELLELYDRLVLNRTTRRQLSVLVHGNKHPMPPTIKGEPCAVQDGVVYLAEDEWLAFRAARPLFPCTPGYPSSSL